MRPSFCLIPLAIIVLGACNSDTSLQVAPPVQEEGTSPGGTGGEGPHRGGGWPGLPPLPPGPWGELDPGEMPEVYFIAAYTDANCCWNCDGYYSSSGDGLNNEDGGWAGDAAFECEVTYGVIDLQGQVLAEFDPGAGMDGVMISHIDIAPSGPGRFLATAQGWGEGIVPPLQTDAEWPPEDGPIETIMWTPWVAWEIDAVSGTSTMVAYQDPTDYKIVLPETGKRIDVSGSSPVLAAIDPADPDWLYIWGTRWGCGQTPLPLRAVHRTDPSVLDRFWTVSDMLPDAEPVNRYARSLAAGIDENGETHLMLQTADLGCGGESSSNHLIDFAPREDVSWSVADLPVEAGVTWAPWNGGAFLSITSPWDQPEWLVDGPQFDEAQHGLVPNATWNVRPGPVLDPAGPTFAVLVGQPNLEPSDAIAFIHGGQEVWRIDTLRFGLQERGVGLLDLIVLPPLPEDPDDGAID